MPLITCNAVGDIVTIASLMRSIIQALSETRGAPKEYRDFVDDLKAIVSALDAVLRTTESCRNDALRECIIHEVDRSWQDVKVALKYIAGVASLGITELALAGPQLRIMRVWCKLKWRLLKRDGIREMGDRFTRALGRLTPLAASLNNDVCMDLRKRVSNGFYESEARDEESYRILQEIYARITSISTPHYPPQTKLSSLDTQLHSTAFLCPV